MQLGELERVAAAQADRRIQADLGELLGAVRAAAGLAFGGRAAAAAAGIGHPQRLRAVVLVDRVSGGAHVCLHRSRVVDADANVAPSIDIRQCVCSGVAGGDGARRPMTTSAAVGKQSTHRWLMRYRLEVPVCSTRTKRTSARILRWCDTVDWATPSSTVIAPTVMASPRRASIDTRRRRVGSESARNHVA